MYIGLGGLLHRSEQGERRLEFFISIRISPPFRIPPYTDPSQCSTLDILSINEQSAVNMGTFNLSPAEMAVMEAIGDTLVASMSKTQAQGIMERTGHSGEAVEKFLQKPGTAMGMVNAV